MAKTILSTIRTAVTGYVDVVSKLKTGNIIFRRGYYYRMGNTPEKFEATITKLLQSINIPFEVVDVGDHWTPFNGGASVARSSHFYVEIKLLGA